MSDARNDMKTAAAVNKGLAAALLVNVPSGIKVMSAGGVPPEVAVRVFRGPQQRRANDWKHE